MSDQSTPSLSRDRNFRLLWLAQSVSLAGVQVGSLAFPLTAVLALGASTAQVALLASLGTLPWLVGGLFVGILIDHVHRRPVLIAAHLTRAATLLSVPISFATGSLTILHLYVVAVVLGTASMFFESGYHAFLPAVAHGRLAEGNSRLAATDAVARSVGPSLAGVIIQVAGAPAALLIQVVTYLVAAVSTSAIHVHERTPTRSKVRALVELREGLTFLWHHPVIRSFMLSESVYLFFFDLAFTVTIVFYARTLGLGPATIGLIYAAGSIGGLIGAVLAPRLARRWGETTVLIGSSLTRGCGLAAVPLALLLGPLVLPCLMGARFVNAAAWSTYEVHQTTRQQLATPDDLRGRVTGSLLFITRSTESLGSFTGAVLASSLSAEAILLIAGAGAVLATPLLKPLIPPLVTPH